MKKIFDFYQKYKGQINAVVLAVIALLGAIYGGGELVERKVAEQVPTQVAAVLRPTPIQATATARPGRGTATATISPSPTGTVFPTLTSVPPSPVATMTPGTGGALPLCLEHPSGWHALISTDGTCHYDHEHKHDPVEDCADDLFGEPGAWYGKAGQSISYPWQTILENEHKHEAYGWLVRCDIPPDDLPDKPNFLRAFRAEVHVDPMCFLMPAGNWAGCHIGAQHSFQIEAQICRKAAPNDCGIFQFGGWMNTGDLNLRDEQGNDLTFCAPLPDVSPACPSGDGGSRIYFDAPGPPFNLNARSHSFFWYGEMSTSDVQSIEVINPTVFAVAIGDSFHEVTLDNLLFDDPEKALFCPNFDCPFNGSTISMHEISLNVPTKLDPDGDGYVDGVFWVDQYGRLTPECMELTSVINPGDLACISWKFAHVPVGAVKFGDPENLGIGVMGVRDFDLSPAFLGTGDEWWITWPKRMLEGLEHDH